MAMNGEGVDRHLFGLRRAARELGLPVPEFFADKGYTESTHFRLSTSSISMAHSRYGGTLLPVRMAQQMGH
jgi:hypothetical protein